MNDFSSPVSQNVGSKQAPRTPGMVNSLIGSLDIHQIRDAVWNGGCRQIGTASRQGNPGSMSARGCLETSRYSQIGLSGADAKKYWESAALFAQMHMRELESISTEVDDPVRMRELLRKGTQSLKLLLEAGRGLEQHATMQGALAKESDSIAAVAQHAEMQLIIDRLRAELARAEQEANSACAELGEAGAQREALRRGLAAQAERAERERAAAHAGLLAERARGARSTAALDRFLPRSPARRETRECLLALARMLALV